MIDLVTPTVRRAADQIHGVNGVTGKSARALVHRALAAGLDVDEIAQTMHEHTISTYTGPGRPRAWTDASARVRNFYLSYARAIRDAALTPKETPMDIQTHGHAIGDDAHTTTVHTGYRTDRITIQTYASSNQSTSTHYSVEQALSLVLSIMEGVTYHAGSSGELDDDVAPTDRIHRASKLHYREPATDECAHDGKGWPCPTIRELNS